MLNVCVYCGSRTGIKNTYEEAALELGQGLAEHAMTLVFGGGAIGLMGLTARASLDHGGTVIGIIPRFLLEREIALTGLHDLVVTRNMHERKQAMFERSDAFIALPGGIGTLEELAEIMTWQQLERHSKPIILINSENYWQPFLTCLEHMATEGFFNIDEVKRLHIVPSSRAAINYLKRMNDDKAT